MALRTRTSTLTGCLKKIRKDVEITVCHKDQAMNLAVKKFNIKVTMVRIQ